ncbi:UDP-N-acetylmuramate dehydrogenase [Kocuria coralli]|uniref:UDP-N-acetylenolpyruvoylglucosamine reductase n=1 Tax=Kocuria coralli TaxID=1461025 RepID=A0A5J5L0T7_9MICC|nr:UDP-N-acetylmuramate dehydrogenase [Kocuria coralli]KAA9395240.1 UDP-N-acetylmuramate dehydrogenase [Kocuria coralli]
MTAAPRPDLADLTTTAVGGPMSAYVRAETEEALVEAVRSADLAGEPVLVVGGGSNLLVGDAGFDGTVVHVATRGIRVDHVSDCAGTLVTVAAGHPWDEMVAWAVENERVGIEALSGIPGTVGATPVQNVGAYGCEVSQTIARVRVYDRESQRRTSFAFADLGFGYRDSYLKRTTVDGSPRYVVLDVQFQFTHGDLSKPVRYGQLAGHLGVELNQRAPLTAVRQAVLELRAGKGMVLDPADRDTYSTGSFFTNPIVPSGQVEGLVPDDAPRFPVTDGSGQPVPGFTKLSAAWLIEHTGFRRGFGLPGSRNDRLDLDGEAVAGGRACLSTKHTLALTNRGTATAADLGRLARVVRDGVRTVYGIELVPEPVLVGLHL